jgi:hypothetical protein
VTWLGTAGLIGSNSVLVAERSLVTAKPVDDRINLLLVGIVWPLDGRPKSRSPGFKNHVPGFREQVTLLGSELTTRQSGENSAMEPFVKDKLPTW